MFPKTDRANQHLRPKTTYARVHGVCQVWGLAKWHAQTQHGFRTTAVLCDRTTLEPRYTTTVAAPAQSPHEPCKPRTHPPTTADARPACVGGPLLHVDIFEAAKPSAAELGTAQWIGRGDDD